MYTQLLYSKTGVYRGIHFFLIFASLERKGISPNGKSLSIFRSMYSQLKSLVKVNNGITQFLTAILVRGKGV